MRAPRLTFAPPPSLPDLTLVVEPLVPARDEDAVIAAALARELPAGTRLEPGEERRGLGVHGWPLRLVQGRVIDDTGAQRETRLVAIYRMLDWFGVIRTIATDRATWEAQRAAVLEALVSADLDVGTGAVDLADALGC
ncbi:MAG: hypothetical protein K8W52_06160 [Deltaproteobacteria bacterium]|nr:hypothetical protein [Deltaproteobacteria bacterium]